MTNLRKIVREAKNTFKPTCDYGKSDLKCLLVLREVYALWMHRAVTFIVLGEAKTSGINETGKKVRDIVSNIKESGLSVLHSLGADMKKLQALVTWDLEINEIKKALATRSRYSKLGRKMIELEDDLWNSSNFGTLLKAACLDRIQNWRSRDEDSADLQQIALTGLVRWGRNEEKIHTRITPPGGIPALPEELGFPVNDNPPWHKIFPEIFQAAVAKSLAFDLPRLQGDPDKALRQALKDHWEKRKALKRTGEEVSLEEVKGQAASQPAKEVSHLDIRRAYKLAKSRWGERGQRFLDALAKDLTVDKASREAGVSRQTGQKYLREIRKELRKPKK